MKLPRDVGGPQLAQLLERRGEEITRQTGSYLRLTSGIKDPQHHITIRSHDALKVGTLSAILADVAAYLEIDRTALVEKLFSQ